MEEYSDVSVCCCDGACCYAHSLWNAVVPREQRVSEAEKREGGLRGNHNCLHFVV